MVKTFSLGPVAALDRCRGDLQRGTRGSGPAQEQERRQPPCSCWACWRSPCCSAIVILSPADPRADSSTRPTSCRPGTPRSRWISAAWPRRVFGGFRPECCYLVIAAHRGGSWYWPRNTAFNGFPVARLDPWPRTAYPAPAAAQPGADRLAFSNGILFLAAFRGRVPDRGVQGPAHAPDPAGTSWVCSWSLHAVPRPACLRHWQPGCWRTEREPAGYAAG